MENTAQREPIYVPYIVVTGLAPVMPPSLPCQVSPYGGKHSRARPHTRSVYSSDRACPCHAALLAPAMFSPTCHVSPSLILLIAFIMLSTPIIFPTYHAKA